MTICMTFRNASRRLIKQRLSSRYLIPINRILECKLLISSIHNNIVETGLFPIILKMAAVFLKSTCAIFWALLSKTFVAFWFLQAVVRRQRNLRLFVIKVWCKLARAHFCVLLFLVGFFYSYKLSKSTNLESDDKVISKN